MIWGQYCPIVRAVNGTEFVRKIRALGRRRSIPVQFYPKPGKGSHGVLFFGSRRTTIKDRKQEIGAGLLADMLRQLGIRKRDL